MRKKEADQICSNLGETGTACMEVMQVNEAFLDRYIHPPIIIPMNVNRARNSASIEINRGEALNGYSPSTIQELDAYDEALVPMGLGVLASKYARSVWYIGSPERSPWGPSNPEKARLTYDLLRSVKALQILGRAEVTVLADHKKEIAAKTKRLVQTLVAVVVAYPDKIYLPGKAFIDEQAKDAGALRPVDTFTRTQAEGLGKLRTFWQDRGMRPYAERAEAIVGSTHTLPEINTDNWNSQLRKERLGIWTEEEREDYRNFLSEAAQAARQRFIDAGGKESQLRLPDPS